MATKQSKKATQNEVLENPEVLAERIGRGEAFLKKNSKILGGVIAVAIVLIGGILFFQINTQNQNEKAQAEMFQAVYFFEQDSVEFAINGDGINKGFLSIVEDYPRTDAANLAHFYLGSIYLSQKKFQEAITHLENFSSDDYLVQSKAYALIGDANLELGNFDQAISNYTKAARTNENKYTSPKYLAKLAVAQEEAGKIADAIATYTEIEEKYYESFEYAAARKHKARLEGLAAK
ncbi:tetratricopeptide repeat protein [Algoriphagus boritolerans]|uniref:Tetratricopeptide repeat-containing protein n=1 Tax=Algoriphagus boritolerans DSM 17298 = JCM 18970 TaxID=1120964 RepID=A0A1H5ZAY9_9BACT|nr:tetratricopeptide repeat protein [Algoriphagus boritolerans]SEG32915.1 Tetratricopeptide repeat-containing protein [Algoriphagus boritolerans DSM 17298 = JCM 18970]